MAPASKKKKRKPPPSQSARTDTPVDNAPELAAPGTLNEQTDAEGRAADGADKEKNKKTKKKKNNVTPRTKARQYNTPLANTRATRNRRLRRKVLALVGRASCLVTGFMFDPQYLHIAHIVAHSLPWWLAEALLNDLGIRVYDHEGNFVKKILNLDTSVNQEILVAWIHLLFDGGIVSDGMDRGDIVSVPEEIDEMLDIIRENDGKKSYRELFPNFTYRYRLRCFSKNRYFYGRYAHAARLYDHMTPDKHKTPQQKEADDRELDENHPAESDADDGAYHPPCAVDPKELPSGNMYTSNGECESRIMECGDQPDVFVSTMCPAFAIHNLCLKMQHRMNKPRLREQLPEEWCTHYKRKLWPATKQWYPTEAEALAKKATEEANKPPGRQTDNSNRGDRQDPSNILLPNDEVGPQATLSEANGTEPTTRDELPAVDCPPSSPPGSDPLEPSTSSPLGLGVNRRACPSGDSSTPPDERIPMLHVSPSDALRDSSPPLPPEPMPRPARRLPVARFFELKGARRGVSGAGASAGAATMPNATRPTVALPKRLGKTLVTKTETTTATAGTGPTPLSPDPHKHHPDKRIQTRELLSGHAPQAPAAAHAPATITPKAHGKARGAATGLNADTSSTALADSADTADPTSIPAPSTGSLRARKAPDKPLAQASGPPRASPPPKPPPFSGPPQRTTRSSTKRSREEASAHDLEAGPQLPEPPKPLDPLAVQQKRRRTKPHEPNIEQDHDPPEPLPSKPRRGKRR
ncbi:hypothetical protein HDZ31DRAFT_63482 [Schizophyllum fasciatum]